MKIPNAWLMGCCQRLEREGFAPLEAIRRAVDIWQEQDRLAALWESEHSGLTDPLTESA